MDRAGGVAGWRWLFIIEGLATVVLAGAAMFVLPGKKISLSLSTAVHKSR